MYWYVSLRTEDSSGDTCARRWQTWTQVSPFIAENLKHLYYTQDGTGERQQRQKATDVYCSCTNAWLQLFPTNWWRLWFNKVYICIPLHSRCTPLVGSAAWTRAGKNEHCMVQHGFHACANVQCCFEKNIPLHRCNLTKSDVAKMKRTTKQTKEDKREWGREKGVNISALFSMKTFACISNHQKNLSNDLPFFHNSQNEIWRCFKVLSHTNRLIVCIYSNELWMLWNKTVRSPSRSKNTTNAIMCNWALENNHPRLIRSKTWLTWPLLIHPSYSIFWHCAQKEQTQRKKPMRSRKTLEWRLPLLICMGCAAAIVVGVAVVFTVQKTKSKQQKKEVQVEKNGNMRTRVESNHHRNLVNATPKRQLVLLPAAFSGPKHAVKARGRRLPCCCSAMWPPRCLASCAIAIVNVAVVTTLFLLLML